MDVATPSGATAAACLPPLHASTSTGPRWHSETDLLSWLANKTSTRHALQVFRAHRNSYVDFEDDLAQLAALGVKSVGCECVCGHPLKQQGAWGRKCLPPPPFGVISLVPTLLTLALRGIVGGFGQAKIRPLIRARASALHIKRVETWKTWKTLKPPQLPAASCSRPENPQPPH